MKRFSDFILEAKQFSNPIIEKNIVDLSPEEISFVKKIDTEQIGKIARRGTNYLICVSESGQMFRSWITNVVEHQCYK